jgi:hypothetical protein
MGLQREWMRGADFDSVRRMVLRQAARLTLPSVVVGVAAAWLESRWIQALLFGVEAGDPIGYMASALVFVAVGALASWVPARHATRVGTVQVLTAQ